MQKNLLIIPFGGQQLAQISSAKNIAELAEVALHIIGDRKQVGYLGEAKPYGEMTSNEKEQYEKDLMLFAETFGAKQNLSFFNPLPFQKQIENWRQQAIKNLKTLQVDRAFLCSKVKDSMSTTQGKKIIGSAIEQLADEIKKTETALREVSDGQDGKVIDGFYKKIFKKCEKIFFLPGCDVTAVRFHCVTSEQMEKPTIKLPPGWRMMAEKAA